MAERPVLTLTVPNPRAEALTSETWLYAGVIFSVGDAFAYGRIRENEPGVIVPTRSAEYDAVVLGYLASRAKSIIALYEVDYSPLRITREIALEDFLRAAEKTTRDGRTIYTTPLSAWKIVTPPFQIPPVGQVRRHLYWHEVDALDQYVLEKGIIIGATAAFGLPLPKVEPPRDFTESGE